MYCQKPVARQSLTRDFLLARDMEKVQATAIAEHFMYQERSEQCREHAVVQYPAENVAFRKARMKNRVTGFNTTEM